MPSITPLRQRFAAFVAVGACVGTWFVVAPDLPRVGLWPAIVIVAAAVMPATLLLVYIALPLWPKRWLLPVVIALALVALLCTIADWGLAANFAKLWAAVFAGWAFLSLFEQLSWVVLVACVRWRLRVGWTWLGMTFMYGFTVVLANALDVNGLPALPFLSFRFLAANADLLRRAIRPSA